MMFQQIHSPSTPEIQYDYLRSVASKHVCYNKDSFNSLNNNGLNSFSSGGNTYVIEDFYYRNPVEKETVGFVIPSIHSNYQMCKKNISKFGKLRFGWNGYKAPSIDRKVLNRINLLLRDTKQNLPAVFPTCRGTAQIKYYFHTDKDYLEVEIFPKSIRTVLFKNEIYYSKRFASINRVKVYIDESIG